MAMIVPEKKTWCLGRVLLLGWLTGCFPTKSPFCQSSNFKFQWLHYSTLLSIVILVFNAAVILDFAINSIVGYARTTLGTGVSAIIAEFGGILYVVIGDGASRLILIFSCRKLIKLLELIKHLEYRRRQCFTGLCVYMKNSVFVIAWANALGFAHAFLRTNNYIGFFTRIPSYAHFALLPSNEWIIRLVFALQSVLSFSSQAFGISLSLCLGVNLVSLYITFCHELRACWGQVAFPTNDWMEREETFLENFVVKFKDLKKGFELYSMVIGPLTFVIMVTSGVGFVHAVYSLSTAQALSFIPGTIGAVFWIGFLSCFGNFLEVKINEMREELRNTLMTLPKCCPFKQMNIDELGEVTKWVIEWKWRLTAGNLFSVNNALLPAAVGTSMTYVIFIFQLRMSEAQPTFVLPMRDNLTVIPT